MSSSSSNPNDDNKPFSTKPNPSFRIKFDKKKKEQQQQQQSSENAPPQLANPVASKHQIYQNPLFRKFRNLASSSTTTTTKDSSLNASSSSLITTEDPNSSSSSSLTDSSTVSGSSRLRKHHSKSRNGCFACKKSHSKCDETKPICSTCAAKGKACVYPSPQTTITKKRVVKNAPVSRRKNQSSKFIELEIPAELTASHEENNTIFHQKDQQQPLLLSNIGSSNKGNLIHQLQQQLLPVTSTNNYVYSNTTFNNYLAIGPPPSLAEHTSSSLGPARKEPHSQPLCINDGPIGTSFDGTMESTSQYSYVSIPTITTTTTTTDSHLTNPELHPISINSNFIQSASLSNVPLYDNNNNNNKQQQQDDDGITEIVSQRYPEYQYQYDQQQQQQQQQQYYNQQETFYPMYKSPRNSPKLYHQAGLPYDYVVEFFQSYVAELLSQKEPRSHYIWKQVIPQLAHNHPLLSNALIAFTCSKMKASLIQGLPRGESRLFEFKSLLLNMMHSMNNYSSKKSHVTKKTLELLGEFEEEEKRERSKNTDINNIGKKSFRTEFMTDKAKTVLERIIQNGGEEQAVSSTYKKLEEVSTYTYGCTLRGLATSITEVERNCVENYFSSIVIFCYTMDADVPMVSTENRENNVYQKQSDGFENDMEEEEDEEEEDKNFASNSLDAPQLMLRESLPDIFEIFKSTYKLMFKTHAMVCRNNPQLGIFTMTAGFSYVLDDFRDLHVFDNKLLKLFVPLLKQIVHMKRGYAGLCDELTGKRDIYKEEDSEEAKKADLANLEELLCRALPTVKIIEQDENYKSMGFDDTSMFSKASQLKSNGDEDVYKFTTDDDVSSRAFEYPSPMDAFNIDFSDPFYVFPAELESCILMLFIVMQNFVYSEKTFNVLYFWSVFRDIPEVFANFARKKRPMALLMLIYMAAVFECSQWFLDFVLFGSSISLSRCLPPEWMPALQKPLHLYELMVNKRPKDDEWIKTVLDFREELSKKQKK